MAIGAEISFVEDDVVTHRSDSSLIDELRNKVDIEPLRTSDNAIDDSSGVGIAKLLRTRRWSSSSPEYAHVDLLSHDSET